MDTSRPRRLALALIVAMSLLPLIGRAGLKSDDGFLSAPAEAWAWRDDRFSVDLVVTRRHADLVRQWGDLGTHSDQWPTVAVTQRIRRGEKVHAVVLFRGCLSSSEQPCVMEMDYVLLRPDGSSYGAYRHRPLWSADQAAPDPRLVYLGGPYLEFVADPGDPLGVYEFVARIRSAENPEGIELRRALEVISEDR